MGNTWPSDAFNVSIFKLHLGSPGRSTDMVVAHTGNPSPWEAEAGRLLRDLGQLGLQK